MYAQVFFLKALILECLHNFCTDTWVKCTHGYFCIGCLKVSVSVALAIRNGFFQPGRKGKHAHSEQIKRDLLMLDLPRKTLNTS